MMRNRCFAVLAALSLASTAALWSSAAHAQCASLTAAGTASTQNFDSLSSTVGTGVAWTDNVTIPNWYSTRTTYNVATGSSNTGALYSFGVAGINAVTDRALGGIGSAGTGTFYWAGCFTNNTGADLASVDIAYIGEQWRDGGNMTPVAQALTFQYQVANAGVITAANTPTTGWLNAAALDFSSPTFNATGAALDGNAVANRAAKSANIPVSVAVGQQIWIRWQDINDTGNDHGLAIDDVSVSGVAGGTPFVLTTNSPQSVNAVVGGFASVTITAIVSNPTPATSYEVTIPGSAAFPPIGISNVTTYIGFPPGNYQFTRPCNPATRGVFQAVQSVRATQTNGPVGGTNPQTVPDVTWVCQTPSDLTLAINDGGGIAMPGGVVNYTFSYANVSAQATAGVALSTQVPVNTSFNASGSTAGWSCANGAPAGTPCTFTVGALGAAPASGSAVFAVNVLPAAAGTTLTVNGSVADDGVGGADIVPANNSASDTTNVAAAADLSVTLVDSPDPVVAGANVTFVATLTNNGPADAIDANASLPLPATLTLVSVASSVGAACTSPAVGANGTVSCTWAGATVAGPGNARTVTVVARVPPNTLPGVVLNAQATVASSAADPAPANNVSTTATSVTTAADLTMLLTGSPDPVIAGDQLSYLASVTNNGLSDAQDVAVSLPLPAGTLFVSAAPGTGGTCTTPAVGSGGTITCSWTGSTAVSAARVLSAAVSVPASATGTLSATATASSSSPDTNTANNTAIANTAVTGSADLALTFTSSPAQVTPGLGITFVASATNNGPSDAQNVQINVVLNAGVQFSSVSTSAGGSCISPTLGSSGTVTCTFAGATASGGMRSITVIAYSYRSGSVSANASASSTTNDPTPANNAASSNVVIGGAGGSGAPTLIPTAHNAVLALLAMLLGLLGFVAVRRRA